MNRKKINKYFLGNKKIIIKDLKTVFVMIEEIQTKNNTIRKIVREYK